MTRSQEKEDAKRIERRRMMLEDPVSKVIPLVALPMVASMLIDSIYNLADAYFVSSISQSATAAVGINDSLMMFMRSISMGFAVGASSYLSRLLGAKNDKQASRVSITTLLTGMAFLTILSVIAYMFMTPIQRLLGATPEVLPYSRDYMQYILLAAPFTIGEVILSQMLRSEGSSRFSMLGALCGCGLNCILDPIFIRTLGLEVAGAAMATSISKVVSFCVLLLPYFRRTTVIRLHFKYFSPQWRIYKEIMRMGIPAFLRMTTMTLSAIVVNNLAGSFGTSQLASVAVSTKCARFIGAAIMGFGQGFQPVGGYCWGAKRYKRVLEAFRFAFVLGIVCATVIGVLVAVFSRQIIGIFSTAADANIIDLGSFMLATQCYVLPVHLGVMLLSGFYQALGMSIGTLIIGLSRSVLCLIPTALILTFAFGEYGLGCAQAVSDILSGIMAAIMFVRIVRLIRRKMAEGEAEVPIETLPDHIIEESDYS